MLPYPLGAAASPITTGNAPLVDGVNEVPKGLLNTFASVQEVGAVNDVIVTVNGVLMVPTDDYSISGTTLTMVTAPAASAEVSVRYLRLN